MHIFSIIQWVGYFHVFRAFLGVFELTIMGDCYDLYNKDIVSLYQCVIETLGRIL